MSTDHLKAAMEETRQQLALAVQQQNEWNFEVYRLQGLLRNLAVNLHETEKADVIQTDMQERLAMGEAIEGLINGAGQPLAPLEVMENLRLYGYDIDRHSNPGARVHQTLKRLSSAGRIKEYRGRYMRNDFNQWLFGFEEKAPQSALTGGEAGSKRGQSPHHYRSEPLMLKRTLLYCIFLLFAGSVAVSVESQTAPANLSATEIADRNVSARGGLQAWLAVHTISYSGKLDAGGKENVQLPFFMEMKRPRKTRVEIEFANDKAVQVYDGANGWKLRPYLGRRDVEPFSADELKAASMEYDLDGPLVDHTTKGIQVDLEGVETVEGHDAYKLKLTTKDGKVRHLWVDTETFLEVKIEGVPRRMDGRMRPVEIYYRDYKTVNGLMVPYVLETSVQGVRQSHKMTIESVVVNPELDDSLFAKPTAK